MEGKMIRYVANFNFLKIMLKCRENILEIRKGID